MSIYFTGYWIYDFFYSFFFSIDEKKQKSRVFLFIEKIASILTMTLENLKVLDFK
jgi:hypothetical protein